MNQRSAFVRPRLSSSCLRSIACLCVAWAACVSSTSAQGPSLPGARIEPEQGSQTAPTPTPQPVANEAGPIRTASVAAPAEPVEGTDSPITPSTQPTTAALTPAASVATEAVTPRTAEFASLLNGTGLVGWRIHEGRTGSWKRTGDVISTSGIGGGWLMSEQRYSDFIMRFEFRLGPGANSGVAIRCPAVGNPSSAGMEIQLLDDANPKYAGLQAMQYTGSVYYHVAPQTRAKLAPTGEWNRCEVRCAGSQVTITINDVTVNDVALRNTEPLVPAPSGEILPTSATTQSWSLAERPPVGHVALQSHPSGVEFRKLELLNLAAAHSSGLQVVELNPGDLSAPEAATTDQVSIHFVGQLESGKIFTDSYAGGEAVTVALGDVIDGWKEGISGMHPGSKRRLIVPPSLAYGTEGVENLIPPDATLVFEVELRRIER